MARVTRPGGQFLKYRNGRRLMKLPPTGVFFRIVHAPLGR